MVMLNVARLIRVSERNGDLPSVWRVSDSQTGVSDNRSVDVRMQDRVIATSYRGGIENSDLCSVGHVVA
jgi:hypothetical protein